MLVGGFLESTNELFDSMRDALSGSTHTGQIEFNEQQHVLNFKTRFLSKTLTWTIQLEKLDFLIKRVEHMDRRISAHEAGEWTWTLSHPRFDNLVKSGFEFLQIVKQCVKRNKTRLRRIVRKEAWNLWKSGTCPLIVSVIMKISANSIAS